VLAWSTRDIDAKLAKMFRKVAGNRRGAVEFVQERADDPRSYAKVAGLFGAVSREFAYASRIKAVGKRLHVVLIERKFGISL
jgi:hypothetical protein